MKDDDFFDPDLEPELNMPVIPPVTDASATKETDTPTEDDPDIDIDEEEEEETDNGDVAGHTPRTTPEKKSLELLGWGWKAWVGFIAIFIAGVAWLVWPEQATVTPAGAQLVDTAAPASAPPASPDTPPQNDKLAESATPPVPPPAPDSDTVTPVMTAQMAAQQQLGQRNQTDIAALTQRIAVLAQQVNTLEARMAAGATQCAPVTASTVKHVSPPAKHAVAPVKKARPVHRAAQPVTHRTTAGWHINTLYPGMAWLSHGDSTWAVRPGDTLQGLHITAIDIEHRRVITDHGVIR